MVTLITNNYDTFGNPTLKLICEKLIKDGVKIRMVGQNDEQAIPFPNEIVYKKKWSYDVSLPIKLIEIVRFWKTYLKLTISMYKTNTKYLLAIDPPGLIMAARFKFLKPNLKIHYFSFEIFFTKEMFDKDWKSIKAKEIYYTKFASKIIIQDQERQEILIKENKIKNPDRIDWNFIPVAPVVAKKQLLRNHYIRDKYRIDSNTKILLHTGTVAAWSGAETYIEMLKQGLPDNYILFIHSRFKLIDEIFIHKELKQLEAQGYPIILHDQFFSDETEYVEFLRNFDFGLAIYQKEENSVYMGENIEHIGLASGKLSYYMAACLPTIATECKTYELLNNKYHFGELVKDAGNILDCLRNHKLNDVDANNCWEFYKSCLNPSNPIEEYFETFTQ